MKFSKSNNTQITAGEYNTFIQKYKLDLPELYRDIMLNYNGGYPEKKFFEESRVYFVPIKYESFSMEDALELSDILDMNLYPFANGSCDTIFCIALDKERHHKIYRGNEMYEFELVADSLEEFIDNLEEDDDDEPTEFVYNHPFNEKQSLLKRIFGKLFRS